jgi:hypothetical protein
MVGAGDGDGEGAGGEVREREQATLSLRNFGRRESQLDATRGSSWVWGLGLGVRVPHEAAGWGCGGCCRDVSAPICGGA